jgi:TetR/AcrR family transcriptional repressor of nem operon
MKNTKREQLLKEGFGLLHSKGYHATGIKEITDAVNTSKGSFYNHFKKKEKFVVELIQDFGELLIREHHEALSKTELSPFQRIEEFYTKKMELVIGKSNYKKGCCISNMCLEEADKSEIIAESIDVAFSGMQQKLSNCLQEAILADEINLDLNTDLVAEFILNSWNGALMRVKASRNSKALDAFKLYLESLKK